MKTCQSFKQLHAIIVLLVCFHGGTAFSSPVACGQVLRSFKASSPDSKVSGTNTIAKTILQMAQLQLLLDESHATGMFSQSTMLKSVHMDHVQKLKELEDKLIGVMTGAQIREAIKSEILVLQKKDHEVEVHRQQKKKEVAEALKMPKFQLSKNSNIKVELDQIPYREKNNRIDQLNIEYLEDTNSLLTWQRGGVAKIVNLNTQQKTELSAALLTVTLSANKKELILINSELNLDRYDLITHQRISSTPLRVLRKPVDYGKDNYKLSISPSGKTVALYSDYTDVRVIEIFDAISGSNLSQEISQGKWSAKVALVSDTAFVIAAGTSLYRKDFVLNKDQEIKLASSTKQFSEDGSLLSLMSDDTLITYETKDLFALGSQTLKNDPADFEQIGVMNSFSAFERDFVIVHRKDNTQVIDQQSLETVFNFGDKYSGEDRNIIQVFYSKKKQGFVVVHEAYEDAQNDFQRYVDFWEVVDR